MFQHLLLTFQLSFVELSLVELIVIKLEQKCENFKTI